MKKNIILITTLFFYICLLAIILYQFIGTFMIIKYDNIINNDILKNFEILNIEIKNGEYIIYEDHIEYFSIKIYKNLTKINEYKISYDDISSLDLYFYEYFREHYLITYISIIILLLLLILINIFIIFKRVYEYICRIWKGFTLK